MAPHTDVLSPSCPPTATNVGHCKAVPEPGPVPPQPSMDDLVRELHAAFAAEQALGYTISNCQPPESRDRLSARVQGLLKTYALNNGGCWHKYAHFNDIHYVRNLVEQNDTFELIVLCWRPGQVSRVHNHADSHCWLAVLDGEMREVQYQPRDSPPEGTEQQEGAVYVEETHTTDMKVGDAGYISDLIALHTVGCVMDPQQLGEGAGAPGSGCGCASPAAAPASAGSWRTQGGVTLHLYSPPIHRVKIYENNTVTERTPGFYSKGGVRV